MLSPAGFRHYDLMTVLFLWLSSPNSDSLPGATYLLPGWPLFAPSLPFGCFLIPLSQLKCRRLQSLFFTSVFSSSMFIACLAFLTVLPPQSRLPWALLFFMFFQIGYFSRPIVFRTRAGAFWPPSPPALVPGRMSYKAQN